MELTSELATLLALCFSVVFVLKKLATAISLFQPLVTRRRFAALGACALVAGLVCGGQYRYRMQGRIDESHRIEGYLFEITSEREPDWADLGECGEDISISIYHHGKRIAKRIHMGSITDDAVAPSFTVHRLPDAPLIIVTPNDRENEIVFVFDTASGECYPEPIPENLTEEWSVRWPKLYARVRERTATFNARIRACPGYEQHCLSSLWGNR